MKVEFKKVLSLWEDDAICFILTLNEKVKIMLDCGINRDFDLSSYREIASQLKKVQIVLISHSGREYSGAYPFLVSQFQLSPTIFYTTQPIMRYSPLNIHQEILNLGLPYYNAKVFSKIYTFYQSMQLLKPKQYKQIEIVPIDQTIQQSSQDAGLLQPLKTIQICCFLAGGSLCSLYWRISIGMVNILYLVQYNNYFFHHIKGLNIDSINSRPTNLLITDTYPRNDNISSQKVYNQIREVVTKFYKMNSIDPQTVKNFNPEVDNILLFACYPNELITEVLFILHKIVLQLHKEANLQKIGVVHLSKRLLKLFKSQSQYFKSDFSKRLYHSQVYFEQSSTLENRINVCSINSINGFIPPLKNVQVFYIGAQDQKETGVSVQAKRNLKNMRIFQQGLQLLEENLGKLSISKDLLVKNQQKIEQEVQMQMPSQQPNKMQLLEQYQESVQYQFIAVRYGIPRFRLNNNNRDKLTQYGLTFLFYKEKLQHKNSRKQQKKQQQIMKKEQKKIQIVNVQFNLPLRNTNVKINPEKLKLASMSFHRTDFYSSLKVIQRIQPKDIIFVNLPKNSKRILANYQQKLDEFYAQQKITVYDISTRKFCYLSYQNDLMEYKISYLPELNSTKIQKVKGYIEKNTNFVHIQLDFIRNEIYQFDLSQFYLSMKDRFRCEFNGYGLVFDGIKVMRDENSITLEGQYSEQFFKVRKQLYQFLKI